MTVSEVDRRRAPMSLERERYSRIPEVLPIPDLIELQRTSYDWFVEHGLRDLLDEISPITDFTGKSMELHFNKYELGEPKYDLEECRARDMTYSAAEGGSGSTSTEPESTSDRGLHGRFPDHDGERHLHHQRRRARGGQPAGALAGRLLHLRRRPHLRPPPLSAPSSSPTAAPGWSSRRSGA